MIGSVRSHLCCLPSKRNMSCLPTSGWVMHFTLLNKHTCIFICADTHTHLPWKTPPWMQTLYHVRTLMQNTFSNMSLSLLSFFISPAFISHIHLYFLCSSKRINIFPQSCAGKTLFCRGREAEKYQHVTNMCGPADSHACTLTGSCKHVLTLHKIWSCPNKLWHTSVQKISEYISCAIENPWSNET